MESGIYKITNTITGKIYIGSAVNLDTRWRFGHLRGLKKQEHKNIRLQNSFNKHGVDAFVFDVIEYCEKERLIEREQFYLDTILFAQEYIESRDERFEKLGYNISPTAGNVLGKKCSQETKDKLSAINVGKPNPKNKGRERTPEERAKISKTLTGRKRSPESIAKQAEAVRGKPKSPEHVAKVAEANRGRVRSPQELINMSLAQKKSYADNPQRAIDRSIKQKEVMARMSPEWHEKRLNGIRSNHKSKNIQNVDTQVS